MPEFYLVPKRLARKAPILVAIAQRIEATVFRFVFWLMRKLSVERALQLSAFAFGLVGPHSDKAEKARENLAIAFPERSQEWREQTTRQIFRHLGYSAAELIKLEADLGAARAAHRVCARTRSPQTHAEPASDHLYHCARGCLASRPPGDPAVRL